MTHDQLLKEIDFELTMSDYDTWLAGARALRAIVELHKPKQNGDCPKCVFMIDPMGKSEMYPYPCPTIQAIEKELA